MADTVRARRMGWNETTAVTARDILDPYDYEDDEIGGELTVVRATGEFVDPHDVYLVGGEVADPATIQPG